MPEGLTTITYDAAIEVSPEPDEIHAHAVQLPIEDLPAETLLYLFPSRYVLSDVLSDTAWQLFGNTAPGWERVQTICDWIHQAITYDDTDSTTRTTALDVYKQRTGICRDFAHLGISFCRALNIPARYVFGYLPEIQVVPTTTPMDFHAWFEVFLGGRWYTCDARHNIPRIGRVIVGYGRDAVDCSMLTTFGPATLNQMTVWADEAG
jgi:transglutaminase-like putative cysteine protease